jgi:hypothetical protein
LNQDRREAMAVGNCCGFGNAIPLFSEEYFAATLPLHWAGSNLALLLLPY